MGFDTSRVICSTITLRHLPLDQALAAISDQGFTGIDLGALPGVCDHVPYVLDDEAVRQVSATVNASGLTVRSINADIGDLNAPLTPSEQAARDEHRDRLLDLAVAIGSDALVLPCGWQSHDTIVSLEADTDAVAEQLGRVREAAERRGIELWFEAPHFHRLCFNLERAQLIAAKVDARIGLICDVSHIVASGSQPPEFVELFGDRITHVHLRDAEPGYIHHSIGNGQVDFAATIAALDGIGYSGKYSLELETRDTENDNRAAAARVAAETISTLFTPTTA
ncbi:sugar phosphate isomerase/epimerase family protein [Lysinibacter cavernae]|uniref:Sugar phosphate isomerase/epimerase n=1 Tax=Lysinibacter cavernae TaxID=1640652 RepID=A0A7X5R188_9MICO|nr:sugar phosphate isomerase/epimerase [Lysinibacter cavernae]NIH53726.1 sugar phosphate isomerase/epimerase [Lysinibacter cavernae]